MATYKDIDLIISEIQSSTATTWGKGLGRSWWSHSVRLKDNIVSLIKKAPAADVVPMVEVERLQQEVETLKDNNEHLAVMLSETREEGEKLKQDMANYEEWSGLKQAKQDVAREIFEEIESLLTIYTYEDECGHYIAVSVTDEFAELKKKYTEGNNGTTVC